jgi:predicted ester cyclase
MARQYTRDELVARLVRAGEIEVTGEDIETVGDYFAPGFEFNGPGGVVADFAGLSDYFASVRAGFDDRSIRRGIIVAEGSTIACQTWIQGTFVREFTQSPVGPLPPNGRKVVWQLLNIFVMDDQGRILKEWASTDNATVLEQLQASPELHAQHSGRDDHGRPA